MTCNTKPPPGYGMLYLLRAPSGKGYVGQTKHSVAHRVSAHTRNRGCRHLYNALIAYGKDKFVVTLLGCYPLEDLDVLEASFMTLLKTLTPEGYNLVRGGQGTGRTPSAETLQRMSAVMLGKRQSPEAKAKISAAMKGVPKSETMKARLGASRLGIKPSPEARAKMSIAQRKRKCSEETRAKISIASRGHSLSPEARQKISAAKKGKTLTAESRARISESLKGKTLSAVCRARISESCRKWWSTKRENGLRPTAEE